MGRSVRRATRIASVLGRPSRRKKDPGIFPPAYMRSSYSTVSGKKSCPALGSGLIVAAEKTMVSPSRTVTAPPACWANLPVSKMIDFPPTRAVYCFDSGFILNYLSFFPPGSSSGTETDFGKPVFLNRFQYPTDISQAGYKNILKRVDGLEKSTYPFIPKGYFCRKLSRSVMALYRPKSFCRTYAKRRRRWPTIFNRP